MYKKNEKSARLPDVVRMEKNGEKQDITPAEVEAQKLLGWTVVGEGTADGNAVVIGTPAHTLMTADGFLKVIPENYSDLLPPAPAVEQPADVKPADKKY